MVKVMEVGLIEWEGEVVWGVKVWSGVFVYGEMEEKMEGWKKGGGERVEGGMGGGYGEKSGWGKWRRDLWKR